jgi:hypothetical protein
MLDMHHIRTKCAEDYNNEASINNNASFALSDDENYIKE